MAITEPDGKDPLVQHIDGNTASSSGSDHGAEYVEYAGQADEGSTLLPTDLPADIVPDKSFQRYVVGMGAVFLLLIQSGAYIVEAPIQQIVEDVICHSAYPDHLLVVPVMLDSRCKEPGVQKTLAMLNSWTTVMQMLVPMFVQIPYGIIADKYGRRPVLFLSVLGITLQAGCNVTVLCFPSVFSVWAMLAGYIFTLIGGGAPMTSAMIWTIVSDAVPAAERTSMFYKIQSMVVIIRVVVTPIAASLQDKNPWLPVWIGLGGIAISMLSVLLIPETLKLRQKADDRRHCQEDANGTGPAPPDDEDGWPSKTGALKKAWKSMKDDTKHIAKYIFAVKSIMLLVVAFGFNFPIALTFGTILLQYMTKRFDWTWATAVYVTTISHFTALVTLLVLLPSITWLLKNRGGLGPLTRDLYLARGSAVFVTLGSLFMAMAAVPWMSVVALIVMSCGSGLAPQLRALLAASVEPHMLGALNSTMSTIEIIMVLISAPSTGWLLARGIELGGAWMGLPFLVTTAFGVMTVSLLLAFRVAQSHSQGAV